MGIDIIKVFSLNALSTSIRMLAGMISVKVIAVIIGPSGIALLGQLNNFSTIVLGLANGGINNGITKYVAEYKDNEQEVKIYISNALRITLVCSLFVGIGLIFLCRLLSQLLLLNSEYYYVFVVFGFTIILFTLNSLLISILNGYKQFNYYVKVSIIGTILGLIYSILLVFIWGLSGALINAVTFQSVMLFVTVWMCRKMPWMNLVFFKEKYDKVVVKRYLGYSLMTIISLALFPMIQMFLRGYVISELSATEAGIWEGMNRVSSMYLSVITSAFSIYYLPRLSEIKDPHELHDEIFRCYKVIIPMLLLLGSFIYIIRPFIIWLLFTPEFSPMQDLFPWQLTGDFFKICSWLLAFIMVAKAKTIMFILAEIFFSSTYLAFSYSFLKLNGIMGLTQGYLCNYIIYLLAMIFLFRNLIKIKKV